MPTKVFVDSDVVISSLISSLGAAYLLLNSTENLELIISNHSEAELERVSARLGIEKQKLSNLSKKRLKIVKISQAIDQLKENYKEYVLDPDDAHIVSAAKVSQVSFLITYNMRHYKIDKIKQDLKIIVLTPAMFIQYLRSK